MAKKTDDATPKKITQRAAVTQALAAGKEKPADGVSFVKEKFDMTLTNQAFSTLKSQLKNGGEKKKGPGRPAGQARQQAEPSGQRVGNRSPAELALAVKQLVEAHGAEVVRDMVQVFEK